MAQSVTLSSNGTATIVLNPLSKATTIMLTQPTLTTSGVVNVEFSLDDPTIPGGPALTWGLLSSAANLVSSTAGTNFTYTVLSPIGGVRINSTGVNTTWTLKALQSITA